jgi:PAS domain S-box-containing protein
LIDPIGQKLRALMDQQFTAIVDSSDDAILVKDLRGVIHSWNRGAEALFGYSADEVIGRPVLVLIPPDREHEEDHILRLIGSGGRLDHFRTVRCRKDRSLVDISLSVTPIRDADGRVIGATKVARDVTETRRRQQQQNLLVQSEQRLAAIIDASDAGILSCDLHGIIQTWSAGATRLFGHRAEDAIGNPITMIIPEDRREEARDRLKRAGAGEPMEPYATVTQSKAGTRIDTSVSLSPIRDLNGSVVSVLLIASDAAKRKRP